MSKLAELTKKREEMLEQVKVIDAEIRKEAENKAFHEFKVEIGSIVKCKYGVSKVAKVKANPLFTLRFLSAVNTSHYKGEISKPWLYVNNMKKDGTYSKREICIYDYWELAS